ncbi:hypothetical protein OS493_035392 [Desmophyllum pertusum]|uniref:Uncharacterized protein n=1 Tax=Desmophyllum pertusum TaxID=174260 RepID=A0A9W9ZX94_9CNID|nr:hypothetical protein OS493_035392 [Desmophyllum pertusum]
MAPVVSVIPVKYVALFFLIAFSLVAVSDGSCTDSSDCGSTQLCCNKDCVYGSSCLGHDCTFDTECSSGESCCSEKCIKGPNCVGYSCSSESDCDGTGAHQNKVVCCDGTCTKHDDCYGGTTATIVGPIVGFVFICMVWCICYACRSRRRGYGEIESRIITEHREIATTTTTTTRCATQSNPLYPGQVLPSYQQGYPHFPLTAISPPHNPGTMAATQQPPPDTAATQGGSGGVYAPKPSYGAVV